MANGNGMSAFGFASKAAGGSAPSPTWSALAAVAIAVNATDAVDFASKVTGGSVPSPTWSAALTAVAVAGNAAAVILLLAPMFTFVKPISEEGSVGDRTVYRYLIAMLNNVAWALYAAASGSGAFFYINLFGVSLQIFYIVFYLWFAIDMKHKVAGILFLASIVMSAVMTALVHYMVINIRFVAAIASVFGGFIQAVPLFDLGMVMWSKRVEDISSIKPFISLCSASTWTAYGRMVVPINYYVMAPNILGIVSAILQIGVYLMLCHKTGSSSMKNNSKPAGRAPKDKNCELEDFSASPV